MKKRLLAALVSLCMVVGMLPGLAWADETTGTDPTQAPAQTTPAAPPATEPTDPPAAELQEQCSCSILCTEDTINPDCSVCAADLSACVGTAPAACSCETRYTEGSVNGDCPVCSAEGAELDKVCVGAAPMLPVTALAVDAPATLYVGQTPITGSGYWKTTADGKLEPGSESDYNVYYDGNGTLTLNNATIQGRGYSGNPQPKTTEFMLRPQAINRSL